MTYPASFWEAHGLPNIVFAPASTEENANPVVTFHWTSLFAHSFQRSHNMLFPRFTDMLVCVWCWDMIGSTIETRPGVGLVGNHRHCMEGTGTG